MSQFLETIQCINGNVSHLFYHQNRVDQTFAFRYPQHKAWNLKEIISSKNLPKDGLFKIRIVYDAYHYNIQIQSYQRKKINTFSLVETSEDYPFKSTDRCFIDKALSLAATDEVIFTKNGKITDSSFANVILFDGEKWWTPDTYLLNGTTRQRLLKEKKIHEKSITVSEIFSYQKIGFINAMNDLGEIIIPLNG